MLKRIFHHIGVGREYPYMTSDGKGEEMGIYLLTEERPKVHVVNQILTQRYGDDFHISDDAKIQPVFDGGTFTYQYMVSGADVRGEPIKIDTVSAGKRGERSQGSFVDYLLYETQGDSAPKPEDPPAMAIEVTKTDASESRNGIGQRISKFVTLDHYYGHGTVDYAMLFDYDTKDRSGKSLPPTAEFNARIMKTLDVVILGTDEYDYVVPFTSTKELIEARNAIASNARKGNTPIKITDLGDGQYEISAKMNKKNSEGISYDPNIGQVAGITAALNILDENYQGMTITDHNVPANIAARTHNKFAHIATDLNIDLKDAPIPRIEGDGVYWRVDHDGEKISSILFDILAENEGYKIAYANHASSERGYLHDSMGNPIQVPKDVNIPDLVIVDDKDPNNVRIYTVEGKERGFLEKGRKQLDGYDEFEQTMIDTWYQKENEQNGTDKKLSQEQFHRSLCITGGKKPLCGKDADAPDDDVFFQLRHGKDGRGIVSTAYDNIPPDSLNLDSFDCRGPILSQYPDSGCDGYWYRDAHSRTRGKRTFKVRGHWCHRHRSH